MTDKPREVYVAGVRVDNIGTDQLAQMMVDWEQKKSERSHLCTVAEVEVLELRRRLTALRQEMYEREQVLAKAKQNVREATGALKILNSLYWDSRRGA